MRIKTVNLINAVGMNKTIDSKDFHLHADSAGVEAIPKGVNSFRNRHRLIPWANISACDMFTAAEEAKLAADEMARLEAATRPTAPPPADPITVVVPDEVPEAKAVDDVIRFTKSESGSIVESKGSRPAGGDVKSAFAAAAKAKLPAQE
jgi:hypothetical protein